MRTSRRRWSVLGAIALLVGTFVIGIANAPIASADTTQNNGCLGVTGTFSQFAVPITGLGAPNPDTLPNPITLSGTSVTIGVDATLISAGVTTGLVTAAPSLATIGTSPSLTAPNGLGVNAVTANVGDITLKVTGSNTVEGLQTASNPAPVNLTFYVVQDPTTLAITVYTALSSPPSTTADPSRTGTVLVGSLLVLIPLSNTTWTPSGGNVVFAEQNIAPSNLLTPTAADQAAAPLILLPKINGAVNAPFHCWPGTVAAPVPPATSSPLTPGPSSAIDTVTVVAPPLPPTCVSPQAATVGGSQSVTVTPNCTDPNGDFTASGTSIVVTSAPTAGTATVNPNGSITYTNTNASAASDTFQYTASDSFSPPHTSLPVTVNITILGNQCTASPSCSLSQVLVLPVLPSTLTMAENAAYGNPTFTQAILGGVVTGTGCVPGPMVLNGQPQTACGALNPLTVINARGTDAQWSVTGQLMGDFIDGTRGVTDQCQTGRNIDQTPPDNHCIPGGNLGWVPVSQIIDPSVPGDTAAIVAGPVLLPPGVTNQTPPLFPPDLVAPRQNTNSVVAAPAGLRTAAATLCTAPANQSGGTFQCDAGLLLAVPGSTAAGTYTALLLLTLA